MTPPPLLSLGLHVVGFKIAGAHEPPPPHPGAAGPASVFSKLWELRWFTLPLLKSELLCFIKR